MKNLDQKSKNLNSSLKNKHFGVLIFLQREFFDP
jgi:hypothetical protein